MLHFIQDTALQRLFGTYLSEGLDLTVRMSVQHLLHKIKAIGAKANGAVKIALTLTQADFAPVILEVSTGNLAQLILINTFLDELAICGDVGWCTEGGSAEPLGDAQAAFGDRTQRTDRAQGSDFTKATAILATATKSDNLDHP